MVNNSLLRFTVSLAFQKKLSNVCKTVIFKPFSVWLSRNWNYFPKFVLKTIFSFIDNNELNEQSYPLDTALPGRKCTVHFIQLPSQLLPFYSFQEFGPFLKVTATLLQPVSSCGLPFSVVL